jgi:hypothetical protein
MYHQAYDDRPYAYYRCSRRADGCVGAGVREEDALTLFEEAIRREIGDLQRREKVFLPGADHTEELAVVREAIATTRREKDLGMYEGTQNEYFSRLENLTARRRELEALPATSPGFRLVDLGETYGQAWGRMSTDERRTMLLDSKIRLHLAAAGKGLQGVLHVPEDVRAALES